jgi:hypothetical protein
VATFSLTESPIDDRNKMIDIIKTFSVIFIRYSSEYDFVNNSAYVLDLSNQLSSKYNICQFKNVFSVSNEKYPQPYKFHHNSFVAMRKDISPADDLFCDPNDPDFIVLASRNG